MYYIPNYVNKEQEQYLMDHVYNAPEHCWEVREGRRVQNYGLLVTDDGKATNCNPVPEVHACKLFTEIFE